MANVIFGRDDFHVVPNRVPLGIGYGNDKEIEDDVEVVPATNLDTTSYL